MGQTIRFKNNDNIVLIGMPGAGKSTIGVLLAKYTSRGFVDSDVVIQVRERRLLQDIVDTDGYLELRRIEERILLSLDCTNHVVATGGSAAYSDAAMSHLKAGGVIVFLDVPFTELERRVEDFDTRGLARRPGQTFLDLYNERYPLYQHYADITIDCKRLIQEQIAQIILKIFRFK